VSFVGSVLFCDRLDLFQNEQIISISIGVSFYQDAFGMSIGSLSHSELIFIFVRVCVRDEN
jgi:hypothetical protein